MASYCNCLCPIRHPDQPAICQGSYDQSVFLTVDPETANRLNQLMPAEMRGNQQVVAMCSACAEVRSGPLR